MRFKVKGQKSKAKKDFLIEKPPVRLKPSIVAANEPAVDPAYHRRYQKDDKTQRLGDKAGADFTHNCLTCSRWSTCHDTNKSANYRCTRFKESVMEGTLDEMFKDFDPYEIIDNKVKESDFHADVDDGDEESILDMIAKIIDSNVPVPPDLRINDHNEIAQARNFYHWMMDSNFAKVDGGKPPFPRQMEFGLKLFSEWCPRCSNNDWFDDMKVDAPLVSIKENVQLLNNGICPKCKATKSELILNDEIPNYFGLTALIGQRASKTSSCILWDGYDLHKTLKLPSPQSVFGTQPTQVFTSTFTALTFNQAVENVWNPYLNSLRETPWFKNYHQFLDRKSEELGEELYNLGEHMVRYRHRNLLLAPAGPSKRIMRGRTRRSSITDEIGQFPTSKKSGKIGEDLERLDANGVFSALYNSLFTLRAAYRRRLEEGYNDLPKPMMYMPSSPSQYNDFIMTAWRLYQNSREFYAVKMSTWDYNPLVKRKDFDEDFRTKPVEAARDYECNPPIGENLFINDHGPLIKAFANGPNKINIHTKTGFSNTKTKMTMSEVRVTSNNLPLRGTVLCVDVGIVNNSFSFSIVGPVEDYDPDILPEDRGTLQVPAKVYAVGEIIPKLGTKISLTSAYTQSLVPLLEPFNVKYFVSDRWNNAKIAQDLEAGYEVIPLEHKCKWEDFDTTRELLISGNLHMPKLSQPFDEILKTTLDNYPEVFRDRPVDHLAWQFATVREHTGVTVLKGDGGTDDSFRTIVLGVAMMQDDEILEELMQVNNTKTAKAPFGGLVRKLSSGGGGGGSSGATTQNGGALGVVRKMR